jgi:holo-[acyl-carrier protein] synthase
MIVGIGTDMVHIPRVERILADNGTRFIQRVLTESEIEAFQKSPRPAEFVAARFAAKEAAAKALGTGFRSGLSYLHIRVLNDEWHRPMLMFSEIAKQLADQQSMTHSHLSITHERNYASAYVVLEARPSVKKR